MDAPCGTVGRTKVLTREEVDDIVDAIRNAATVLSLWASKIHIGQVTHTQRSEIYHSIKRHVRRLEDVADKIDLKEED